MKQFLLPLLFIICSASYAQVKTTKLNVNNIPKGTRYTGKVIDAVQYTDNEGSHVVILTQELKTGKGNDSGLRDADVYAYNYLISGDEAKLTWQLHDLSHDCGVDVGARYIPGTFAVTDLNKDGKAEVWLMYLVYCQGDVSPSPMKLIMHEGDKKYAARGTTCSQVGEKDFAGGTYKFDDAFLTGPAVFKQYADQLWKKNITQRIY